MNDSRTVPVGIVGSGPAGTSAALWLHSLNLEFEWYGERVGGTLHRVHNAIHNYPGIMTEGGSELSERFEEHTRTLAQSPTERRIASITRSEGGWRLDSDGGPRERSGERSLCVAESVILATGTEYRRLDIPGESEGIGEYVSQSVAREAERWTQQTVAMVGGGDSGFEGALRLSDQDCRVHLLLRSEPKARSDFKRRVRQDRNIMVHPVPTVVDAVEPLPMSRGARLRITTRGTPRTLEVACLFVRIGVEPVFPTISPAPSTGEQGHIKVNSRQETSQPGLLAAGDVTDSLLPAVATAVGDGARAAEAAAHIVGHK